MSEKQRRDHYRVSYPANEMPMLILNDGLYPISNLSQGGAQFICSELSLKENQNVKGSIKFEDGDRIEFQAEILRLRPPRATLKFLKPLPYKKLTEEQMRLRKKYPVV